jgi:hypothetical protein
MHPPPTIPAVELVAMVAGGASGEPDTALIALACAPPGWSHGEGNLFQERGQFCSRLRTTEVEPLAQLAAEGMQSRGLLGGFDAFGYNRQTQRTGQAQDRGDDSSIAGVGLESGHELAIDLQLIKGQALQVGQIRVTSPEVVDRQRHAQPFELA